LGYFAHKRSQKTREKTNITLPTNRWQMWCCRVAYDYVLYVTHSINITLFLTISLL